MEKDLTVESIKGASNPYAAFSGAVQGLIICRKLHTFESFVERLIELRNALESAIEYEREILNKSKG